MSIRDTILEALIAKLNGVGKPADLTIHEDRTVPLAQDGLPAQVVYELVEDVKTGPARGLDDKRLARRTLQICIESRADASGSTPRQALSPLLSWAVKAVCSTQQLVPSMHDVLELGTAWEAEETNSVRAAGKTVFQIEYVTSASDPDAAS